MFITSLLDLGLLIVVAKLAEGMLRRVGLSSIVAYTLAGALLGPVAGIVEPTADVQIFLSVGVFLFFFLIGLDEIDLPGFVATIRGRYFVAAALSVVISILASLVVTSDLFGLDFALGLEFGKALALAGILSLSSLGVVSLSRLRFLSKGIRANTPLSKVLRRNVPMAWPNELIDDVMQRMAAHSLSIIPVLERDSERFLGTIASPDVLDMVALMKEVQDEVQQRQAEGA